MTRYAAGYLSGPASRRGPAVIAGDGNWGIGSGTVSRIAWFRLDWSRP
jgi:hypothetical protein